VRALGALSLFGHVRLCRPKKDHFTLPKGAYREIPDSKVQRHTTADGRRGRRAPFSTDTPSYCLIHTYSSLARLPPTHPFVCAPIFQLHFHRGKPGEDKMIRKMPSALHFGLWSEALPGNVGIRKALSRCQRAERSRSMARNGLRTRPPGVDPRAANGDGRRDPFASIPHHTLILLARASAPYSLTRPRNGNFAHASRSDGPRNLLELQALHPAQTLALVLYCSDLTRTLLHTGRSLDHRNPTDAQRATSARCGFLIVCCSDCTPASFPYASASLTHSHTH
jgi:hypothetical protein